MPGVCCFRGAPVILFLAYFKPGTVSLLDSSQAFFASYFPVSIYHYTPAEGIPILIYPKGLWRGDTTSKGSILINLETLSVIWWVTPVLKFHATKRTSVAAYSSGDAAIWLEKPACTNSAICQARVIGNR